MSLFLNPQNQLSKMNKVILVLRIVLGLMLIAFALNKLPFVPEFLPPPNLPPEAQKVIGGLAVGYVLPWLVGITELVVGVLLVSGQWVPLALVLLAPLSVNLLAFHLTTSIEAGIPAYVVAGLNLILMFLYYPRYSPLLKRQ